MRLQTLFVPGLVLLMSVYACGGGDASVEEPAPGPPPLNPPVADSPPAKPPGTKGPEPAPPSTFACAPARPGAVGERTLTLSIGGQDRTVLVHVPKAYDPTKGTSLVVGFHGYGMNAAQMRTQTKIDAESDTRGFIAAYAEGTGLAQKGFNGGDCCGRPAWTDDTDDLSFGREIVKKLSAEYCVDPKRVYSAGFSNGGFMSYRFVCEAADVFAAVASVSGVLGTPPESCKPSRPVPILHVHGTADTTVPYQGGPAAGGLGILAGVNFRSVPDTVAAFKSKWTCGATSKEVSKAGDTRCEEWTGCQAGVPVELCTITDGGHQWPGGQPTPVGGKTSDFAATKAVLDFFAAHVMP
jgi:polyhydroxybutyrate depolymerase